MQGLSFAAASALAASATAALFLFLYALWIFSMSVQTLAARDFGASSLRLNSHPHSREQHLLAVLYLGLNISPQTQHVHDLA
jgi:hypothetical protein